MNEILLTADEFGGEEVTKEVRDAFEQQVQVQRDAKGNIVLVRNGQVVGTLQKAKSLSYEAGLQAKFQQKRLEKIKAKHATK